MMPNVRAFSCMGLTLGWDDDDVDVVLGKRRARRTVRTSELKVHRDGTRVQRLDRQDELARQVQ